MGVSNSGESDFIRQISSAKFDAAHCLIDEKLNVSKGVGGRLWAWIKHPAHFNDFAVAMQIRNYFENYKSKSGISTEDARNIRKNLITLRDRFVKNAKSPDEIKHCNEEFTRALEAIFQRETKPTDRLQIHSIKELKRQLEKDKKEGDSLQSQLQPSDTKNNQAEDLLAKIFINAQEKCTPGQFREILRLALANSLEIFSEDKIPKSYEEFARLLKQIKPSHLEEFRQSFTKGLIDAVNLLLPPELG